MSKTILTRGSLEIYEESKRDPNDRRRRIAWAVFSYYDENGIEYRKSFKAPQMTPESEFWTIAPLTMEQ